MDEVFIAPDEKGANSALVDDQIKNLLAMGGGVFESVKGIKAVYAVLQSMAPNEFPLKWDVIFFSIYSRKLMGELSFLILGKGEIKEVLWREKASQHPFHHLFFLADKARRSFISRTYEDYTKPYYSDVIVWTLLKPKFVVYWAYFLEMLTFQKMPENQKRERFLPTLENHEKNESRLKELQSLQTRLCGRLEELNISALQAIEPTYAKKKNLYLFLPFELNKQRHAKFLDFFRSGRHNKYVDVQPDEQKNSLEVRIDPDGVREIYDYIHLSEEEVGKELARFNITEDLFDDLVETYTSELRDRIFNGCQSGSVFYRTQEAIENRCQFLKNIPVELKKNVLGRAKELLSTLKEFYPLAKWRYDNIIEMLNKLAGVTQTTPIHVCFESYEWPTYLNESLVNEQTMVGLEFSDAFREAYADTFGYEMPSDSLHHICHFVQPGEALKAIYTNNDDSLLDGGPVLGSY